MRNEGNLPSPTPTEAKAGGIPWTRPTDEGRGLFGREEKRSIIAQDLQKKAQEGRKSDEQKIHAVTERITEKIVTLVTKTGHGTEKIVKVGDAIYRGAQLGAKRTLKEGQQVIQGLGEDFVDVTKGLADKTVSGIKWAGVAAGVAGAVIAASPVLLTEALAMGAIGLGQRGAKELAVGRAKLDRFILQGIQAGAAAVEARALAGQAGIPGRLTQVEEEHRRRIKSIRARNLLRIILKK
ncbi:hypothetical protein HYV22_03380 [Candidatus Gottesmanbacteria bacterium]|nr:hypothetical protein [Candidatus Gottesmanbacteria bacterium]